MQFDHPSAAVSRLRSGFQISPDITIDVVEPERILDDYPIRRFDWRLWDSVSLNGYNNWARELSERRPTDDKDSWTRQPLEWRPSDGSVSSSYDDEYESDDGIDPNFHPLSFCAITMEDDDERKDDLAGAAEPILQPSPAGSSKCKKSNRTTQSKENSSLVCNGREPKPGGGKAPTTKKRYPCDYCDKTFGWSTDLRRHTLIHTGERPFKCNMCSSTFTRNFLLQKHKSKLHECLTPKETSLLNNNVAKNVMEIKLKMKELEQAKSSNETENG